MQPRECKTCWRQRPETDFAIEGVGMLPICRSCRAKLWVDPDDAGEIRDVDAFTKAEFREQRLAIINRALARDDGRSGEAP